MDDGGARRRTPLFEAQHSDRYVRQALMLEYQEAYGCRMIVLVGPILDDSVTIVEELLFDADPDQDLHLLLTSPGGYGDPAIRLVRGMQARCRELTVLIPDRAKSAATLLALGAHWIVMGPMSDLGPIDPQFDDGTGGLVAAKDIIAAYERALRDVEARPSTFPVVSALLLEAGVDALQVEAARAALARTAAQLSEAVSSHPDRSAGDVKELVKALSAPLISKPTRHEAIFSASDAKECGLPVRLAELQGDQWQRVWQLWAKYFELNASLVFESAYASQVFRHG